MAFSFCIPAESNPLYSLFVVFSESSVAFSDPPTNSITIRPPFLFLPPTLPAPADKSSSKWEFSHSQVVRRTVLVPPKSPLPPPPSPCDPFGLVPENIPALAGYLNPPPSPPLTKMDAIKNVWNSSCPFPLLTTPHKNPLSFDRPFFTIGNPPHRAHPPPQIQTAGKCSKTNFLAVCFRSPPHLCLTKTRPPPLLPI